LERRSLTWRSMMAPSARRNMKLKSRSTRVYVISFDNVLAAMWFVTLIRTLYRCRLLVPWEQIMFWGILFHMSGSLRTKECRSNIGFFWWTKFFQYLSSCLNNLVIKGKLQIAIIILFVRPRGWSPRAEK
jgi:hypothetical protein